MDSTGSYHTGAKAPNTNTDNRSSNTNNASTDQLRRDFGKQLKLGPRRAVKPGEPVEEPPEGHVAKTPKRTSTVTFSDPRPEPSCRSSFQTAVLEGAKTRFFRTLTEFIEATDDYELTYPENGVSTHSIGSVDVENDSGFDTDRWFVSAIAEDEQPRIVLAKSKPFEQLMAAAHGTSEVM